MVLLTLFVTRVAGLAAAATWTGRFTALVRLTVVDLVATTGVATLSVVEGATELMSLGADEVSGTGAGVGVTVGALSIGVG
jgi:hypothetical protein